MLRQFLQQAQADEPVYLTDVRRAFQREGRRPFHLQVTLYDGAVRRFPLLLPDWEPAEEAEFVAAYVHATVFNILSALGAAEISIYLDPSDKETAALAAGLNQTFQTGAAKRDRTGFGKCLNVNERVLTALDCGAGPFSFRVRDIAAEPAAVPQPPRAGAPVFASLPGKTAKRWLLGIDVGGTDVKLAVSVDGKLAFCKEFDWAPASFTRAEQLTEPLLLLTRTARALACLYAQGKALPPELLEKDASLAAMEQGAAAIEADMELRGFDAIGLSFPDVIIHNRIVGGETTKTLGMRENTRLDYEVQFAKIGRLTEELQAYTLPGGPVLCTNDGPMSAFTAAVEEAAAGGDASQGFFAHSLGTELGTGWVLPDGSIPNIPLEIYSCIIDLGSFAQRQYDAGDVRSVLNMNTGLPGTLQKYAGQSGVFRLAAKHLPVREPELFQEALDRGLFLWEGDRLVVPTGPADMRKACLEFFMEQAGSGRSIVCQEIFREIGAYLAVTWAETMYLLEPQARDRTLFGRLVKRPGCFQLMCQGAQRREPELVQRAADENLAITDLMRQLAVHPQYTVAQFAQAVGAVYYSCLGLA